MEKRVEIAPLISQSTVFVWFWVFWCTNRSDTKQKKIPSHNVCTGTNTALQIRLGILWVLLVWLHEGVQEVCRKCESPHFSYIKFSDFFGVFFLTPAIFRDCTKVLLSRLHFQSNSAGSSRQFYSLCVVFLHRVRLIHNKSNVLHTLGTFFWAENILYLFLLFGCM